MKSFKAPGGDLNVWSVLWFLAGTGTLVMSVIYPEKLGLMGMLFGAALAIPSALLWWGSYRAANFLILLMFVGIVLGFINLMTVDATFEQKMPRPCLKT